MNRALALMGLTVASFVAMRGQVIEFESNGLKYQTLTKSGITVIFAPLPNPISDYSILQVSVSNGSTAPYVIRPEDFTFTRADGNSTKGVSAKEVVAVLYRKGSAADVVKLVTTYETAVYGNTHIRSTNGYEQRRQGALATTNTRVRAAATASALALVQTKLAPGESTDGAVFFTSIGKPLGPGRLVVQTNTDTFQFNSMP